MRQKKFYDFLKLKKNVEQQNIGKRFWFLLIVAIGIASYLPFIIKTEFFTNDAYYYLSLAQQIIEKKYYLEQYRHLRFMPFYPFLIFFIKQLSWGFLNYIQSAKLLSVLILLASSFLVFRMVLSLSQNYFISLISFLMCLFLPIFLLASGQIFSELPLTLLGLLVFWSVLNEKKYLPWIFTGIALLTRYEAYFLVPALIYWRRKKPREVIVGLGIIFLMISPWLIFIFRNLGEFIAFSYPIELFRQKHAGAGFLFYMLISLSPMVIILGGFGIYFLKSPLRSFLLIYLGGYIAIHLYWYALSPRFILPIAPFFILGTGLFFNQIGKEYKRRIIFRLLIFLTFLSLFICNFYIYQSLKKFSYDPKKRILEAVLTIDPSPIIISNIDPQICRWYKVKSYSILNYHKSDPYLWVVERYLKDQARYLVWAKWDNFSIYYFPELAELQYSKKLKFQGKFFLLTLYPVRFLKDKQTILFAIEVKKL